MADLTPADGTLVYCTPVERDLIYALRADPDQHRHVVQVEPEADEWFTLRHPIMERIEGVAGSGLFECPVFEVLSRLQQDAWPEEIGRYRVSIGESDGTHEYVDFEGPLA